MWLVLSLHDTFVSRAMNAVRVLVVDDHAESAKLMVKILTVYGYVADSAASCEQALTMMKHETYDAFVLDVHLQDCSGIHLCKGIKAMQPQAPVLFCSAHAFPEQIAGVLSECGDGYFTKPIDWDALAAAIRLHLDPRP